jgi:nucleoid-associated protein YgaU
MSYTLRPIGSLLGLTPQPAAPKPAPAPVTAAPKPAAPKPASPKPTAAQFVEAARRFIGQPFAWGGGHGNTMSQPGPVDASGLVQQAARMSGIKLDGTAAHQQKQGTAVAMTELKAGDLVFKGTPATHVGIYVGNGRVIAASKPGTPVRETGVAYFDNARRVFSEATGGAPQAPAPTTPVTPPAPAAPTGPATYTVKGGDTLWRIASKELGAGARWQEIYALNPHQLPNPSKLTPGQVLKMPALDPTGGAAKPLDPFFNDDDY